MLHRASGLAFAACVVVTLLSQATHISALGCGNVWLSKHAQTTWEGKLRVQQQSPEPAIQTGLNFLTYFTYTRITMTPDSDTFTQLIVGQDIEDTVTCEYTCHDDKLVSHGDIRFDVVSGKVMAGSDAPFSKCPENADDPNMQLVAKCQAGAMDPMPGSGAWPPLTFSVCACVVSRSRVFDDRQALHQG